MHIYVYFVFLKLTANALTLFFFWYWQVSFYANYGFADQSTKEIYQRAHDELYNEYIKTLMKSSTLVR